MNIHYDMPFAEYQALPGINASAIAKGRKSMLHMRHEMTGPRKPPTAGMRWGSVCHAAVLEPERFHAEASVWTGKARRGKAYDEFMAEVSDPELIVTQAEADKLCLMIDSVWKNATARNLIEQTEHEVTVQWEDGRYGLAKGRLDLMSDAFLADYKTTGDVTPDAFFRTAYNLGYHIKMGWYAHGAEVETGKRPPVMIIVQEQDAPYDCWVCDMDASIVRMGEEAAIDVARRYHACSVCGAFPGVVDGVVPYELPEWATKEAAEVDISTGAMDASEL